MGTKTGKTTKTATKTTAKKTVAKATAKTAVKASAKTTAKKTATKATSTPARNGRIYAYVPTAVRNWVEAQAKTLAEKENKKVPSMSEYVTRVLTEKYNRAMARQAAKA